MAMIVDDRHFGGMLAVQHPCGLFAKHEVVIYKRHFLRLVVVNMFCDTVHKNTNVLLF